MVFAMEPAVVGVSGLAQAGLAAQQGAGVAAGRRCWRGWCRWEWMLIRRRSLPRWPRWERRM